MIYAFSTATGALLMIEADDSEAAHDMLVKNGYQPIEPKGQFEAMGTVLVVRSIGGTDVYVSETGYTNRWA